MRDTLICDNFLSPWQGGDLCKGKSSSVEDHWRNLGNQLGNPDAHENTFSPTLAQRNPNSTARHKSLLREHLKLSSPSTFILALSFPFPSLPCRCPLGGSYNSRHHGKCNSTISAFPQNFMWLRIAVLLVFSSSFVNFCCCVVHSGSISSFRIAFVCLCFSCLRGWVAGGLCYLYPGVLELETLAPAKW